MLPCNLFLIGLEEKVSTRHNSTITNASQDHLHQSHFVRFFDKFMTL